MTLYNSCRDPLCEGLFLSCQIVAKNHGAMVPWEKRCGGPLWFVCVLMKYNSGPICLSATLPGRLRCYFQKLEIWQSAQISRNIFGKVSSELSVVSVMTAFFSSTLEACMFSVAIQSFSNSSILVCLGLFGWQLDGTDGIQPFNSVGQPPIRGLTKNQLLSRSTDYLKFNLGPLFFRWCPLLLKS